MYSQVKLHIYIRFVSLRKIQKIAGRAGGGRRQFCYHFGCEQIIKRIVLCTRTVFTIVSLSFLVL